MAPSRSLLQFLSRAQPQLRPCQRLAFSTRHASPTTTPATTTPAGADMPALVTSTTRSARFTSFQNELSSSITCRNQQRRYKAKTVEEARSRYRTGPFSWKAGVLFVLAGCGLVWYFESEKKRMQRRRMAEATKGVGKPKVGGDFNLVDHEGKPFSSANLKGRYSLVSLSSSSSSPASRNSMTGEHLFISSFPV